MKREWRDPYALEPRPKHRATEEEREEFMEAVEELAIIAAHLGASIGVDVWWQEKKPRRPR